MKKFVEVIMKVQNRSEIFLVRFFKFLLTILVAGLVHFLIKKMGLESFNEAYSILLLWMFSLLVAFCFLAGDSAKFTEVNSSESDFSPFPYKPTQKRINLEKIGIVGVGTVEDVLKISIGAGRPTMYRYMIKYSFSNNGKEFVIRKRYFEELLQEIPKIGDKIKIMYDRHNPNDSIIVHQEADKVKWYQLQRKFKLEIINTN
jgi:hypothetical protein